MFNLGANFKIGIRFRVWGLGVSISGGSWWKWPGGLRNL